jgi:hypothetical protein
MYPVLLPSAWQSDDVRTMLFIEIDVESYYKGSGSMYVFLPGKASRRRSTGRFQDIGFSMVDIQPSKLTVNHEEWLEIFQQLHSGGNSGGSRKRGEDQQWHGWEWS